MNSTLPKCTGVSSAHNTFLHTFISTTFCSFFSISCSRLWIFSVHFLLFLHTPHRVSKDQDTIHHLSAVFMVTLALVMVSRWASISLLIVSTLACCSCTLDPPTFNILSCSLGNCTVISLLTSHVHCYTVVILSYYRLSRKTHSSHTHTPTCTHHTQTDAPGMTRPTHNHLLMSASTLLAALVALS